MTSAGPQSSAPVAAFPSPEYPPGSPSFPAIVVIVYSGEVWAWQIVGASITRNARANRITFMKPPWFVARRFAGRSKCCLELHHKSCRVPTAAGLALLRRDRDSDGV